MLEVLSSQHNVLAESRELRSFAGARQGFGYNVNTRGCLKRLSRMVRIQQSIVASWNHLETTREHSA
ncbi:hypothetical protein BELL_0060g00040 [Botrytis elliptica]|uniref:Uncharacterized protein n=1 Tax=Botrytis elliptica TaxID=278938 RepID=A0A4Z1K3N9_9HELO|nr:hypothetical protein BELL_0060g00040 [Botrytis elliptica]